MSLLVLLFSVASYLFFLGVFTYLVLFIGGDFLKTWLPFLDGIKTINSGPSQYGFSMLPPVMTNIIILAMFGFQHSIMARPAFKRVLTSILPESMERSVFVLASNMIILWMFFAWTPMPAVIWQWSGAMSMFMMLMFLTGATIVLWSTFMINHWQLFGLSQAWHAFKGTKMEDMRFAEPALYKYSRHPLYLGMLIVFWATPTMTLGHLIFGAVWTAYVFIGIGYEERDLMNHFGDRYMDYMKRIPQLLPFGRRN